MFQNLLNKKNVLLKKITCQKYIYTCIERNYVVIENIN